MGLAAERSPELVVGILGILKAGGAYVPLDPAPAGRAPGLHAGGLRPARLLVDRGGDRGERAARRRRRARRSTDLEDVATGDAERRADVARRPSRLRHLHLGLDRPAQGGGVTHASWCPCSLWSRATFGLGERTSASLQSLSLRLRLRRLGDADDARLGRRPLHIPPWRRPAIRRPSRGGSLAGRGSTRSTPRRRFFRAVAETGARPATGLRVLHLGGEALRRATGASGWRRRCRRAARSTTATARPRRRSTALLFEIGRPGGSARGEPVADRPAVGGQRGLRAGPRGRARCRSGCRASSASAAPAWPAATWAGRS